MTEIRCVKCKRLLMKARIFAGEIKCPKCGYMQYFSTVTQTINVKDDRVIIKITP